MEWLLKENSKEENAKGQSAKGKIAKEENAKEYKMRSCPTAKEQRLPNSQRKPEKTIRRPHCGLWRHWSCAIIMLLWWYLRFLARTSWPKISTVKIPLHFHLNRLLMRHNVALANWPSPPVVLRKVGRCAKLAISLHHLRHTSPAGMSEESAAVS